MWWENEFVKARKRKLYLGGRSAEEIAVKDAIITLLARKSLYWIINIDNRPILREELKKTVQGVLKEPKPPKIFITKFVLQ